MIKNKTLLATLAALCAQVIFGFSFMFTKISMGYASPLTVIADRYIAAFVGLTIVMLITRTKMKMGKSFPKLVMMSLFQPVLYFLFETYGIKLTTSSFSAVMISLIPVMSLFSGMIFLKEIPTPLQYLFTVISVAGVIIITISGNSDGTVTPQGVVLLIGAVVSSVGFNTASRKISAEYTALERTYAMTVIGLICFFTIALAENSGNVLKVVSAFAVPEYTLSILYLGVVSSVVAFIMLNFANTHLPVARTTVFSNITTVVSVIAGAAFLEEKISAVGIVSIIMIVVGVWGVQMSGDKKQCH